MSSDERIPVTKRTLLKFMTEENYSKLCDLIKQRLEKLYGPIHNFWLLAEKGEELNGT